jgi:hypothetical protein
MVMLMMLFDIVIGWGWGKFIYGNDAKIVEERIP